jgi:glutamine amidotransferase PdxT
MTERAYSLSRIANKALSKMTTICSFVDEGAESQTANWVIQNTPEPSLHSAQKVHNNVLKTGMVVICTCSYMIVLKGEVVPREQEPLLARVILAFEMDQLQLDQILQDDAPTGLEI